MNSVAKVLGIRVCLVVIWPLIITPNHFVAQSVENHTKIIRTYHATKQTAESLDGDSPVTIVGNIQS